MLCKSLKISRSRYYNNVNKQPSKRDLYNAILQDNIKDIYWSSNKRYGAPKIHKSLEGKGIIVSLKRVQRHMRILGLRSIVTKKYKYYTNSTKVIERTNILNRNFDATKTHQKWCGDITYIHVMDEGWTYLATVMDLYSRKIIGYSYSKSATADLTCKALENACLNVKDTRGIIFHTDLGVQYTCYQFGMLVDKYDIIHSFSRKGNPYDNATIESFNSILKKEEVNRRKYHSFNQAKYSLFEFIEFWYNRVRIHSSIGYKTPNQVHSMALVG